jgi:ParB/RepB/Spo0J family partition protein
MMNTTRELIPLDDIRQNPFQPRLDPGTEEEIADLARSIEEIGLLQPPVGRRVDGHVELATGHRRLAAYQYGQENSDRIDVIWDEIPIDIRELDDQAMFELAVIENLQRKDLNPIERARAMATYRDHFGATSAKIGELFGLSDSSVRNALRLLTLPEPVQEQVSTGGISETTARKLLTAQRLAPGKVQAIAAQITSDSPGHEFTEDHINRTIEQGIVGKAGAQKMWSRWNEGAEPLAGPGLWPLASWSPPDPQNITHGEFMKAFPQHRGLITPKDWERAYADACFGAPAPSLMENHKIAEDLAADIISIAWPPNCSACPHHAVFNGEHYCGLRACFENKKASWLEAETRRVSAELGIKIYDAEKDGKIFDPWQYSWGEETTRWEEQLEAKDPYLRLRPKYEAYSTHQGTDSLCVQVVSVDPKKVKQIEKERKEATNNKALHEERDREYAAARARRDQANQWFENHAEQVLARAFDALHPALIRRLLNRGDSGGMSKAAIENSKRALARTAFWTYGEWEKGPVGLAKYLAGAASEIGLALPEDWLEQAKRFEGGDPESETVSAETVADPVSTI